MSVVEDQEAERGRSRFSKALPTAPRRPVVPPKSVYRYLLLSIPSPAPTLPQKDAKMSTAPIMIPRRAVGSSESIPQVKPVGKEETAEERKARASSIVSLSSAYSVYSDSPSLSHGSDSSRNSNSDETNSPSDSESGPPPLPPKDSQRQNRTPPNTPPQTHVLAQPSSGFNKSPVAIDLWRRRSVRSEKSIHFSELKLERSNGSTASPPQRQEQSERSLPAIPFQIPRSSAGQRKPVPLRPAPAQPDLMGNKLTKLKEKHSKSKLNEFGNEEPMSRQNGTATQNQDPANPTFDLNKENIRSDLSTPPSDAYSTPPDVPSKSNSRPTTRGTNGTTLLPSLSVGTSEDPIEFLSSTTSHTRDTSETLTISSEPTIMASPQKPNTATRILTPEVSPSPSSSLATSPLALSSPTKKIHFPTFPAPVANPGTIFPGPPISNVQLECYQNHRFMRSTRNALCPVACMVCQRRDAEQRWRCSWCCLSACGSCMQVLAAIPGKDLRVCLDRVGRGTNGVSVGA